MLDVVVLGEGLAGLAAARVNHSCSGLGIRWSTWRHTRTAVRAPGHSAKSADTRAHRTQVRLQLLLLLTLRGVDDA